MLGGMTKYKQRMRSAYRQPRQMNYNRLVPLAWIPIICLREPPPPSGHSWLIIVLQHDLSVADFLHTSLLAHDRAKLRASQHRPGHDSSTILAASDWLPRTDLAAFPSRRCADVGA